MPECPLALSPEGFHSADLWVEVNDVMATAVTTIEFELATYSSVRVLHIQSQNSLALPGEFWVLMVP
jgi:hypothetical protein